MKTHFKYSVIFSIIFFVSCYDKKKEMNENICQDNLSEMRSYLLKNKKTSTLKIIWYTLHDIGHKDLILPDALFMAEFAKNPFAYHLVFEGFCYKYFPEIEYFDNCNKGEYFFKLPKNEREIIIRYLEKGAEQKFFKCVDDLIQIYEFEKNPKAEYYKNIKDLKYIEDFY